MLDKNTGYYLMKAKYLNELQEKRRLLALMADDTASQLTD